MRTLHEVLRNRASTDRDRVALDFEDRSFTFQDLHANAAEWAVTLAETGARPGSRVALMAAPGLLIGPDASNGSVAVGGMMTRSPIVRAVALCALLLVPVRAFAITDRA